MDMSASSLQSVSGAGGSSDSLHGLKFKRNIYFADVSDVGGGIGSSSKASASAASMAAASPPKKGKGVVPGGQQRPPRPPRCQVEGCSMDLTGAKAYYCRHKVCGMHSKSPKVVVAGMEQRFCQQCSSGSIFVSEGGDKRIFSDLNSPRFHQLHEFDQGKRSCRRRLACHNERRRKPPPRPLSSHMGHLSSAFHEDNNHFKGFLVDFTHPKFPALVRNAWQIGQTGDQAPSNQYQSGLGSSSARVVSHGAYPYMQDPMSEPILSTPGTSRHSGGSDSSCALSLLSTQPWDSTSKLNDRLISARCSIDGRPIAEPVCKNDYTAGSWDSKGIEGSSSSTSFEVRASQVGQPESSHFSGELELALLGKRQCMGLDPSRRYRHSDDAIHWSL